LNEFNVDTICESLEVVRMFTPIETTVGAVLLHQATSNLLYQNGNILGLSGYLRRLINAPTVELLAFFTGMAASYVPLKLLVPELITRYPSVPITVQSALFTTGVAALIGWGTKVCLDVCQHK
jgi:hypothetical protein